MELNQSDSSVI